MASTPQLTLIVPAYNASECIRTCLDDLLAQTFTDFNVLLMDDGSTDTTAAIGDEYACRNARIKVVRLPHRGVSAARNKGLELADSRFVAFMDSDDRVAPDYLATFFRTPLPDDDMLASPSITSGSTGPNIATTPTPTAPTWPEQSSATGCCAPDGLTANCFRCA